MYENETYEVIFERMLSRIKSELDKRPSSPIYDTLSPTAIEFQILYIELETMIKNSYGDTAEREFLILLANDRGLEPEPATNAVLKGEFTPDNIDVIWKRFNIGELNYVVTKKLGPGQYEVKCETAGEIGNQYLGQMIPVDYISGLETAKLTEVLVPGEDEEDTEIFRQRYFESFKAQTFGGNKADYLAKVRSIDGVGDVKVDRAWNGNIHPAMMIPSESVQSWYESYINTSGLNSEVKDWLTTVYAAAKDKLLTVGGTVHVTVVDADDYGVASDTLLQNIQTILDPEQNAGEGDGLAPIGHVVIVDSAEAVALEISTILTFDDGYSWPNCRAPIEKALNEYLLALRKTWAEDNQIVVRISQLENRMLNVMGVIDIADTKINGSTNNLILGPNEIPILGGVADGS